MSIADAVLLEQWQNGDRGAGATLVDRHLPSLMRFFRSKVAGGTPEDLVQATLLACVERKTKLNLKAGFRAYLFGIARNVLYDHLRSCRLGHQFDAQVSSVEDLGPGVSSVVAARDGASLLTRALQSIPLELQIILELYYWEGFSAERIAAVFEQPIGTVRTKIRRAKRLTKEQLQRHGQALPDVPDLRDLQGCEGLDAWVAHVRQLRPSVPSDARTLPRPRHG